VRRDSQRCGRLAGLLACGLCAFATTSWAQETVQVTVPVGVTFSVTNVAVATPGSPAPSVVSFTGGSWPPPNGTRFVISVRADAANFTPPAGASIPAARVSWTASASAGNASNGTLSSSAYGQVLRGANNAASGSVSVTWQLAAINDISGLKAGNHALTARWRFEVQ
jgi:hypothetical protein